MPARRHGPICRSTNPDFCLTPGTLGIRDAWDASRPALTEPNPRLQGPISLAERGEHVLADASAKKRKRVSGGIITEVYDELNIVGDFPFRGDPWKNDAEIRAALLRDNWFPADKELDSFANSKRPKENTEFRKITKVYAFLNTLFSFPARRINLFIHGTSLSGHVEKKMSISNPASDMTFLENG